ncbi:MAG: single-stranded-DNA-specific exonuclease RecJ, partial [Eubacterium sp.]|nr:single-stranded-DNA-specific exonuclease RecJ [Eubacterium sp.]
LWRGFTRLGIDSKIFTPDRIKEGYGLNRRIVDQTLEEGRDLLITCDNGIAANEAVAYAKEHGLQVIVTDHHEPQEILPEADTILDPKLPGETYPFKGLCGAGVAFKLICALYEKMGIDRQEAYDLLEFVAIATVADVMELVEENRILVKEGLKRLEQTANPGLRALIKVQDLQDKTLTATHIGFVIGPCFNAAGRISSVEKSFELLMEEDEKKALDRAQELKKINDARKQMTEEGALQAYQSIDRELEEKGQIPDVLVVLLKDVHESLAGIIAGRIKEKYNHPTIAFTEPEPGIIKGSGRSIEAYDMFAELMKVKDLMIRFGGHKMAAGMTLEKKDIEELRKRLNQASTLTEEDFRPVVEIDAAMPVGYVTERLIEEFSLLEPFGTGNRKPVFAEQHFRVLGARILGQEKNILKLQVMNEYGNRTDAMLFRGKEEFEELIVSEWGGGELKRMYQGRENDIDVALTYYPTINEFRGVRSIQIVVGSFCRIKK